MTWTLLAAAAGEAEGGLTPYIAGGIAAAVFIISAIVVRSFRDVAHRSATHEAHAGDEH